MAKIVDRFVPRDRFRLAKISFFLFWELLCLRYFAEASKEFFRCLYLFMTAGFSTNLVTVYSNGNICSGADGPLDGYIEKETHSQAAQ